MYRKTYALIDCDALTHNIKEIVNNYDYKYYIGVVKANAYGHGDYVVDSLIKGGINYLAVSSLEEGLRIRKRNNKIPILCLQPINSKYLNICEKEKITVTIPDMDYLKTMDLSKKLKAHIKIDSGMNRLGFKDKNDVKKAFDILSKHKNILIEGIYTHLATSGLWDSYFDEAIRNFQEITSLVDLKQIPIVHLGRSLTLSWHQKIDGTNGIRLGIIMYGINQKLQEPRGLRLIKRNLFLKRTGISQVMYENKLNLKTALSLRSVVMCIKTVNKGQCVGYGAHYIAPYDIKIAIIPIGYADGIPKNIKTVKINEKKCQVVGEVCMDMIAVLIDDSVKLNDEVIIYDDIKDSAAGLNISTYQLFTQISTRVPRVYKEDNKYTEIQY